MLGVDIEALRGIGAEVGAAATTLRKLPAQGLAPAPRPGSSAAVAAQAAAKAWLADLRRLTADVTGFGARLTDAARDLETTDRENAGDLRGPR
ncbi:hypothetical protein BJY16_003744 [Actinoplanes octamycinicus]|uniref:Excreted virulence factor EspC (Type VII ESX diderm) n=1 Tax=Actinoplanes octamycinicus TaxID=135948 RepID=A0A7W7GXS0_9ACTN|nr:hypothetical protein [Actinoplanes octamycinicus]MBB4740285.1 hypothetical protein [Actinoplanes octamycinicus]GIE62639.1 hypothetical protein Aoc01nite_80410 [Actinoplanes octamycinicus]